MVGTEHRPPRSAPEAWFRVVRPPIVLLSVVGSAAGALNVTLAAGKPVPEPALALGLLSSGLLAAGLMVHNDYTDLPSDRVNRPWKPIPSGAIAPRTAEWSGLGMMLLSALMALLISIPLGILSISVLAVGVAYNHRGKHASILGHAMVAYGVGAIPYYGALAMGDALSMLPLAAAVFVMEIGREIMVCAGDIVGDRKAGFRTLPVLAGKRRAMLAALLCYILSVPFYPIPYLTGLFGPVYLIGSAVFLAGLFATWALTYARPVWDSFERYIRTGTRLFVFMFQMVLIAEVFF